MTQCRVSVLLPTYNRAPLLRGVLAGLLSQPMRDIEIIVMDDGSQDDTQAVTASFADARVRYFRRNRMGPTANLNEALGLSKGQYVMVVHDHDFYDPEMLTEFAAALDRHPSAAFAFCSYIFIDNEAKAETQRRVHNWPEMLLGREFLQNILLPRINSPILGLSMIRKKYVNERFLDVAVGACADVELWHRLASVADVAYVKRPLIKVRERDKSSQFHSAQAAVEMMEKVLNAKKQYLKFEPSRLRREWIRLGWRLQVDGGGVYAFWKAFEANGRNAMKAAISFVRREGTPAGYLLLLGLFCLPRGCGVSVLRFVRRTYRAMHPKSRTKPA